MSEQSENTTAPFLEVKDLAVEYYSGGKVIHAVNGVNLTLEKGKTLGLVGETGAGKTTIAKSILRILPDVGAKVANGQISLDGQNLLSLPEHEMRKIRGNKISMIFQDPMTALNPVQTVGDQIAEAVRLHNGGNKRQAEERAEEMLKMVGISADRYYEYPHQFSGGMKQRVVIAIALACNPDLLLADEPTTALDVSIQAQVLNLLKKLQQDRGLTYMFVTHDMSVVRHISDDICVMYLGQVVEKCPSKELFKNPLHPYTKALLSAIPSVDIHHPNKREILKGEITSPINPKPGCRFAARCPFATEACYQPQKQEEVATGHFVRCCRVHELG